MPAASRPRGATVVRENQSTLLGWRPSRDQFLLAALLIVGITTSVLIKSNDSAAPTSGANHEPSLTMQPLAASLPAPLPASSNIVKTGVETTTEGQTEPEAAPEHATLWIEETIRTGDNLSLIFKRAGFTVRDVHHVVTQSEHGKSLERIYPGQSIAFQANKDGKLAGVKHIRSKLETVTYHLGDEGFESALETRTPEVREAWASGKITSSLFMAGQEAGLSQNLIMELANIFGGVIDFVLDPRKGDTIHLLFEEQYIDGEKYRDGEIIAASFTNRGKTFNALRYIDSAGQTGYFNEDGVSMRKAFLLAPVDFTRISSNFNLRRLHPIYKTTRPHRGTDYAASRGTPVYAAGDGRVSKAGYSKSNGNYVFIQHGEQYVTKYLHLHKRHVKRGQRVSQSQVIGTVGSTGAATGPHLHYEFLMNGVHRNPRTIHKKLPKAKSLATAEMTRFHEATQHASTELAALTSDNRLAMSNSASDGSTAQ